MVWRTGRWRDVDLVESVLRVRDSKTEDGVRSIALSPTLAEELWQHRRAPVYELAVELQPPSGKRRQLRNERCHVPPPP